MERRPCRLCAELILPATFDRQKGLCGPCKRRPRVRLPKDRKPLFQQWTRAVAESGWVDDLPHRRDWLDLEYRLKEAAADRPELVYLALSDLHVSRGDCEEPIPVLARLRRVSDAMRLRTLDGVPKTDDDPRLHLINAVNQALESTEPRRVLALPEFRGRLSLVFARPEALQAIYDGGLVPDVAAIRVIQAELESL